MNIHCPYCRQNFNLGRDFIGEALREAEEKRLKYHAVECISCRKIIKVSIAQMKPYAPPPEPAEDAAE